MTTRRLTVLDLIGAAAFLAFVVSLVVRGRVTAFGAAALLVTLVFAGAGGGIGWPGARE